MFKAEQYIGDSKEVMILYFYQPFESWKYFLFHLRHKFNIIDELLPDSITTLKLEKDEQISI